MNESLKVTRKFHFARRQHGRKQLHSGSEPEIPVGRIPRIARLIALAIKRSFCYEYGPFGPDEIFTEVIDAPDCYS